MDGFEEVFHCGVDGDRAVVDAMFPVELIEGHLEQVHDSFADIGGVREDLDQFLDPRGRFGAGWGNEWVEAERGHVASDRVDPDLVAGFALQECAVVLFPVEDQEGFVLEKE
ncbi:MAG: hypothetical protein HONDAALG_01578 [Gammaproteobacteria bacterium]|nr:hypothetical protein [Gammaproteobacteria bacterium]